MDLVTSSDPNNVLKQMKIKCSNCGTVWLKHYKRIEKCLTHGTIKETYSAWKPSKEFHFCAKPKPSLEETRKDWL
jgi:hypothetical protein